jgi:sorting nexin-4
MAVIEQHDEFSNVSWHSDQLNPAAALSGAASGAPVFDDSEPVGAHHPEMEEDPTRLDPGLSGDILECTVTEPLKESDGTKDAFVSYLITTNVCPPPATPSHTVLVKDVRTCVTSLERICQWALQTDIY